MLGSNSAGSTPQYKTVELLVLFVLAVPDELRIEVGVATAPITAGDSTYAAGSYVIKLDQPYGRLAKNLLEQHRIWTVAIDSDAADVHGVRVTPNIFTTPEEVDGLAAALRSLA